MNTIDPLYKNQLHVRVRVAKVYGSERIYPVNELAHIFSDIAGTTTLNRRTIELIRSLGYTIDVEQEQVTL
jgi:hypothetical protein